MFVDALLFFFFLVHLLGQVQPVQVIRFLSTLATERGWLTADHELQTSIKTAMKTVLKK
mgnify:CR=1 FL=1